MEPEVNDYNDDDPATSVGNFDVWSVPGQGVVKTHGLNQCEGRRCCVHAPSDHHMATWPMIYDEKKLYLALRLCEHGYAHPDPDSLWFFANRQDLSSSILAYLALHQCDGCCLPENIPESV